MPCIIIALALAVYSLIASANNVSTISSHQILIQSNTITEHSGRTDKDGCHIDRKTGTRHCH